MIDEHQMIWAGYNSEVDRLYIIMVLENDRSGPMIRPKAPQVDLINPAEAHDRL